MTSAALVKQPHHVEGIESNSRSAWSNLPSCARHRMHERAPAHKHARTHLHSNRLRCKGLHPDKVEERYAGAAHVSPAQSANHASQPFSQSVQLAISGWLVGR